MTRLAGGEKKRLFWRLRRNGDFCPDQAEPPIFPIYCGLVLDVSLWMEKGYPIFRCHATWFLLGFLPWIGRNMATLGIATDNRLMVNFLHHGMYPDFMYKGIPQSHGFPYRYDPRAEKIGRDLPSVIKEISSRFLQAPSRHEKWYLLDKPRIFWSWNIIQGSGDAFVYPVSSSPYFHNTFFRITHRLMYILHYPVIVLALFGCLMVWFPLTRIGLTQSSLLIVRFCSLLLIYYKLIDMAGAPSPRYSVPLRPFLYGMALFTPFILIRSVRNLQNAVIPDLYAGFVAHAPESRTL